MYTLIAAPRPSPSESGTGNPTRAQLALNETASNLSVKLKSAYYVVRSTTGTMAHQRDWQAGCRVQLKIQYHRIAAKACGTVLLRAPGLQCGVLLGRLANERR